MATVSLYAMEGTNQPDVIREVDRVGMGFCTCETDEKPAERLIYSFPTDDEVIFDMCFVCGGVLNWEFPDVVLKKNADGISTESFDNVYDQLSNFESELDRRRAKIEEREREIDEYYRRLKALQSEIESFQSFSKETIDADQTADSGS